MARRRVDDGPRRLGEYGHVGEHVLHYRMVINVWSN
jgi:hypothetical protein